MRGTRAPRGAIHVYPPNPRQSAISWAVAFPLFLLSGCSGSKAEDSSRVTEQVFHERSRSHDRAAQGRQGLQTTQLSRFTTVRTRENGRPRRRAHSLVEQLPRTVRRAIG